MSHQLLPVAPVSLMGDQDELQIVPFRNRPQYQGSFGYNDPKLAEDQCEYSLG